MSIVPLFIVLTVIISFFTLNPDFLVTTMIKFFPTITSQFLDFITYLSNQRTIFGIFGFLVAFYFANNIFTSLHTSIVKVFEKEVGFKRTAFIYLIGVPVFTALLILIYIAIFLSSSLFEILLHSKILENFSAILEKFEIKKLILFFADISKITNFVAFFILLFGVYYYFPPVEEKNKKYIFNITFFISILMVLFKLAFNYYIVFASKANPIYGSLSGIFAFLAWLYISYSVILIGARALYYLYENLKPID